MIKTTKETYNAVFERDGGCCKLCKSQRELQLHHIMGRGPNHTNNPNECVMLCRSCHELVHSNNKYWRKQLLKIVKEQ